MSLSKEAFPLSANDQERFLKMPNFSTVHSTSFGILAKIELWIELWTLNGVGLNFELWTGSGWTLNFTNPVSVLWASVYSNIVLHQRAAACCPAGVSDRSKLSSDREKNQKIFKQFEEIFKSSIFLLQFYAISRLLRLPLGPKRRLSPGSPANKSAERLLFLVFCIFLKRSRCRLTDFFLSCVCVFACF